jgi:hypothetical protein
MNNLNVEEAYLIECDNREGDTSNREQSWQRRRDRTTSIEIDRPIGTSSLASRFENENFHMFSYIQETFSFSAFDDFRQIAEMRYKPPGMSYTKSTNISALS